MPIPPRLFLARHGYTTQTLTGQHTGVSEIPLTDFAENRTASASAAIIGPSKGIDPVKLTKIYISPRIRARRTAELLIPDTKGAEVVIDERVREWVYGRYEGMTLKQILVDRRERGLDIQEFSIWKDGCEDSVDGIGVGKGESPAEMQARVDEMIEEIREIQGAGMAGGREDVDILIALAKRWVGFPVRAPVHIVLDPGEIGTLTYANGNINQHVFLLSGAPGPAA